MANIKLGDLYFSKEESKDIIKLITKKRNSKNYESKSSDKLYNIFEKQSKNKQKIDDKREELKNPTYNISKSELKDIKSTLYNIEKQKNICSKKTSKYLDELNKRILNLDKYHDYDDYEYKGVKDIEELFKISIDKDYYKLKLNKSGYYARLIANQNAVIKKLEKELIYRKNLTKDIIDQAKETINENNNKRLKYYDKYKNTSVDYIKALEQLNNAGNL